jgi:hypothetical protein
MKLEEIIMKTILEHVEKKAKGSTPISTYMHAKKLVSH